MEEIMNSHPSATIALSVASSVAYFSSPIGPFSGLYQLSSIYFVLYGLLRGMKRLIMRIPKQDEGDDDDDDLISFRSGLTPFEASALIVSLSWLYATYKQVHGMCTDTDISCIVLPLDILVVVASVPVVFFSHKKDWPAYRYLATLMAVSGLHAFLTAYDSLDTYMYRHGYFTLDASFINTTR